MSSHKRLAYGWTLSLLRHCSLPRPWRRLPKLMAVMASLIAHVVYGVLLGELSGSSEGSVALSCSCS